MWAASTLLHVVLVHCFPLLQSIPCMHIAQLIYSFYSKWTCGLFLVWHFCKQCCWWHSDAYLSPHMLCATLLELPGHRFCICSAWKETSKQFSRMVVTTYIHIRAVRGTLLLHSLAYHWYHHFFFKNFRYYGGYLIIWIFISLMTQIGWHISFSLLATRIASVMKCVCLTILPVCFSVGLNVFFLIDLWVPYTFCVHIFCQIIFFPYCLPLCGLYFISLK